MKQVVRRVIDRKGRITTLELPEPHMGPDQVLVANRYSLISSGTEMATLSKTPVELVRQTLSDPWMGHVVKQTVFSTGIVDTARRVWLEMVMPREIGYSGAGTVLDVGENVRGLEVGQTVAYAATGHAEIAAPALNHIVPVPADVDLRQAAFVTVGGIATQSLRRAEPQFGEVVAVVGLGLVGQICAMIAKAAGCVVVGVDVIAKRNELALECGTDFVINPARDNLERRIMDLTGKHGVDATIVCASSRSSEIINSSMAITRRQGRVVIVGYVKLDIHPKEFLTREIDLRYSRAYGPGSYHQAYESGRVDYPFGYVRWTENRNLGEFVRLVSTGAVDLAPLVGASYTVADAQKAFEAIADGTLPGVAALIDYGSGEEIDRRRTLPVRPRPRTDGKTGISVIGCGNHFLSKHLPHLRSHPDLDIRVLASATGKNASIVADRAKAVSITSDVSEALEDPGTDAVLISSGHAEHFGHLRAAIAAEKAIYVEKPLVSTPEDFRRLCRVCRALPEDHPPFTLGLNRRYSPMARKLLDLLDGRRPHSVEYLVSQPYVPPEHWTLDEVAGAGRLITEGEHFIDLCNLLLGRRPSAVTAKALGEAPGDIRKIVNFSIHLLYEDAVATIVFCESAAPGWPREQITVMGSAEVAVMSDFAKLDHFRGRKQKRYGRGMARGMGHEEALREFVAAVRGEPNHMLSWDEVRHVSLTMFAAQESLRRDATLDLAAYERELLTEPGEPAGEPERQSPLSGGGGACRRPLGCTHGASVNPEVAPPRPEERRTETLNRMGALWRSRWWRWLAGGLLIALLLRNVGPGELLASLGRVEPLWVIAVVAISAIWLLMGSFKVWLLLRSLSPVSLATFVPIYALSWAVTNIVPGPFGDAAQVAFLRRHGISPASSGAAYLVDKCVSLGWMVGVAITGLALYTTALDGAKVGALVAGGATLVVVAILLLRNLPAREGGLLARLRDFSRRLLDELNRLRSRPWLLLSNVLLTILKWATVSLKYYCTLQAFGATVPLVATATIPVMSSLVGYLPVTVGGMGTTEWTAVALFGRVGAEPAVVLSAYLLMRVLLLAVAGLVLARMSHEKIGETSTNC